MGVRRYINRILKKEEKEREPESAKLFRDLEQFYKEHPHAAPHVSNGVNEIRAECDTVMEQLQKDFDQQHEETTCVFLRRELDFIRQFVPQKV